MHRNTYLLITILGIFAALVVGVNIGKRLTNNTPNGNPATTPASATFTPTPTIKQTMATLIDSVCKITLQYPDTLVKVSSATGSALLADATTNEQKLVMVCQNDIPRPPLAADRIETRYLTDTLGTASVSARTYHDASQKDGTPIDQLIYRNPKTGLDIFIAGYGQTYNDIIATLKLLP